MMFNRPDDHDYHLGLEHDLVTLTQRMEAKHREQRRRALMWLASGSAAAALAACGGASDDATASTSSTGSTASASSAATTTTAATSTAVTGSSCIADPAETNGPYPSDGSNTANGTVSDILTASGIVRSNIRSSFGSSTTTAAGVPLVLTVSLVNVATSCAALSDFAIYIWHCNSGGEYSLYASDLLNENYLRGVQVTDGNGQVTFDTIFPACYSGRYPHIHFEIYRTLALATGYRNALLTAQMAMPSAICSAVFEGSSLYSASIDNFAQVTTSTDMVFESSTAPEIALQTPSLSGSVADGFTGTITIGVAA